MINSIENNRTIRNLLRTIISITLLSTMFCSVSESRSLSPRDALLLSSNYSTSLDSADSEPTGSVEGWTTKANADRGRQSPSTAMFKSLFVPGLGQLGNRKYLKAALIIGGETFLFMRWLDYRSKTVDARAALEAEADRDLRAPLFSEFDRVRNKRNLNAWLTGTLIFASMIDAFVDAHLAKFPGTDDKVSFKLAPGATDEAHTIGITAKLSLSF